MKTIAVIYATRRKQSAAEHHKKTLEELFGEYVNVENHYFDEIEEDEKLENDAFLLTDSSLLLKLRRHIDDYRKIILMNLNITRESIPAIMSIPGGSDVLVVNDTPEGSSYVCRDLYELGACHLNLVPFDSEAEAKGEYKDFEYALTPGESRLVPQHIPHVIDFNYRVLSFSTLVQLAEILELDSDIISRNLVLHLDSIAERENEITASFVSGHLKTQLINLVIKDLPYAIMVVNGKNQLIYSNEYAERIIVKAETNPKGTEANLSAGMAEKFMQENVNQVTLCVRGINYIARKFPLTLMDKTMGYCFMLHSENQLREMEVNLSRHRVDDGMTAKYHFKDIVCASPKMEEVISIAKKAATTDYTVLIQGESGTGKELLAQSIHNYSQRVGSPFVAINCSTLPESLLESELFGYEGGSFTGAQKNGKAGLFEKANHGTIFLDEIGDISQNMQIQLLRVLQEKQVMRIGSSRMIDLDVRIIAASNKNLENLVLSGNFRSDLFYRLSVIPIEIPPLRSRKNDVLLLMSQFLGERFNELSDEQKQEIADYSWPGNVRQLENAANYYKTFSRMPSYFFSEIDLKSEANENTEGHESVRSGVQCQCISELGDTVLSVISEHTELFHGIGRSAILAELKKCGISISDGKLRHLLNDYRECGYITVEKGRGGCRITQAGSSYLAAASQNE